MQHFFVTLSGFSSKLGFARMQSSSWVLSCRTCAILLCGAATWLTCCQSPSHAKQIGGIHMHDKRDWHISEQPLEGEAAHRRLLQNETVKIADTCFATVNDVPAVTGKCKMYAGTDG